MSTVFVVLNVEGINSLGGDWPDGYRLDGLFSCVNGLIACVDGELAGAGIITRLQMGLRFEQETVGCHETDG